jgi:predicted metalloprotease with PDZ domain
VLHFFTNAHGDYHKPTDDWEKIDRAGLSKVSQLVTELALNVANKNPTITLVKGAGKPPTLGGVGGNAAYLGTIPDFSPVEKGVKLSGVREGSPAAAAGIKSADVIIKIDDAEIKDLQAYSDVLRAHKPGDVVRITVLRDGQPVVLTATLGRR